MSFDSAKTYLDQRGFGDRVITFEVSSATVELAAAALHCEPCHIAKTLSFLTPEGPVLVVAAGDARINNPRFKAQFGCKAKMLTPEQALELVGHAVGGVCPFGVKPGVRVVLDESLRRFDTVYPACGNAASAVRLSPAELYQCAAPCEWAEVCSLPRDAE